MIKKQSTLFPENEVPVIAELDLIDAEKRANQVKCLVCTHCDKIEIAGSIRRQNLRYVTLILSLLLKAILNGKRLVKN